MIPATQAHALANTPSKLQLYVIQEGIAKASDNGNYDVSFSDRHSAFEKFPLRDDVRATLEWYGYTVLSYEDHFTIIW